MNSEIEETILKNKYLQERFAETLRLGVSYRKALKEFDAEQGTPQEYLLAFPIFDAVAEAMALGKSQRVAFAPFGISTDTAASIASRHHELSMTLRKARYAREQYQRLHDDEKQAGRPSTYTEEKARRMVELVREGLASSEAASRIGTTYSTVMRWRREQYEFDLAMISALRSRRAYNRKGPPPLQCQDSYEPFAAKEIIAEVAKGRRLEDICRGEGMPSHATAYRWMERHAEFRRAIIAARQEAKAKTKGDGNV